MHMMTCVFVCLLSHIHARCASMTVHLYILICSENVSKTYCAHIDLKCGNVRLALKAIL